MVHNGLFGGGGGDKEERRRGRRGGEIRERREEEVGKVELMGRRNVEMGEESRKERKKKKCVYEGSEPEWSNLTTCKTMYTASQSTEPQLHVQIVILYLY